MVTVAGPLGICTRFPVTLCLTKAPNDTTMELLSFQHFSIFLIFYQMFFNFVEK